MLEQNKTCVPNPGHNCQSQGTKDITPVLKEGSNAELDLSIVFDTLKSTFFNGLR